MLILIKLQEGVIGITDHAQHELGDIVHVELPEVGTSFNKGESIVSIQTSNEMNELTNIIQCGIESVKTAADVYAPVNGDVTDVNKKIK